MKRIIAIFIACTALVGSATAQGTPESAMKNRKQTVYMFGVATSINDSLTVITDLQPVSVYLQPNGFLAERSLYSLQLNNYMVSKQKHEGMTCAVFFNKNKTKAEKRFQRVKKKFREKHDIIVRQLGRDLFNFETEELTAH